MRDWPKNSPWKTREDAELEIALAWERIKGKALEKGLLQRRNDGMLQVKCHPNKLFDMED